ncbi:MAG: 50S ribosomal protein L13 [Candidatus Brennerbacteria bacterium]|nr:50S ribosomal protein L13 [Candidatus Brennerbacteria bacterium]
MEYTIDAKGKKLGRLASQVAGILQGKHSASYEPRLEGTDRIVVTNIRGLALSERKLKGKRYHRHTGPLGHLKTRSLEDAFEKDPSWVFRHAVRLMLPKNKLLARRMKRLAIQ